MSDRITRKDLTSALALLKDAAVSAGITEASRWHLDIGSKTYGRAYRLWLAHEDYEAGLEARRRGEEPEDWHTGHYSPVVSDYLGMTAAEAFRTLHTLRHAFQAVVWAAK